MKNSLESLSVGSGAILIALLWAAVVGLLCYMLPVALRRLWVVLVPIIFAYCLTGYRFGSELTHLNAAPGAVLGVGTWFLAGTIPSAAIVVILRKRHST
jgi:hypothetical protein